MDDWTKETVEKILEMHKQGYYTGEIARELKVSEYFVVKVIGNADRYWAKIKGY